MINDSLKIRLNQGKDKFIGVKINSYAFLQSKYVIEGYRGKLIILFENE